MEKTEDDFVRKDTGQANDQQRYPEQAAEDYPFAADSTGDGDPIWREYYRDMIRHTYDQSVQDGGERESDDSSAIRDSIH